MDVEIDGIDPLCIESKEVDLDDKPFELIVNPSSTALTFKKDRPNFSSSDHIKTPLKDSLDDDMLELKKAAALGKVDTVKEFCARDDIIQKLVAMVKNKKGDNPLFEASKWDQPETVRVILLAAERSDKSNLMTDLINLPDEKDKETPISYAASCFHKKSCIAIINFVKTLRVDRNELEEKVEQLRYEKTESVQTLSHDLGIIFSGIKVPGSIRLGFCKLQPEMVKTFVEQYEPIIDYHKKNDRDKSLIDVLLRKMPDLVEQLLDKSISLAEDGCPEDTTNRLKDKGDIHRVIVDFGVLAYHPKRKDGNTTDDSSTVEDAGPPAKLRHYRHGLNPLQVLARTNRHELLMHPVVYALITKKWEQFAKFYFYSVTFLFYLLFFSMLMVYQFTLIKPFVRLEDGTIVRTWIANSSHSCEEYPDGCFKKKSTANFTTGYFVLIMSGLRLFLEMLDLFNQIFVESHSKNQNVSFEFDHSLPQHVLRYLRTWVVGVGNYFGHTENLLEVTLYGTSVLFSLNVLEKGVISSLHWQLGTLCVLTSFMNLLILFQIVPLIGVYITMFFRILWTFISKILALLTFFVIAFVIIFHMLLSHTDIYEEAVSGQAIYKTLSQGVSGVAYEDYKAEDYGLTFPEATLIGLIAFAILVQVLFLNLATGLAIEDIKKIRRGAEAAMNVLTIRHIFNAGRSLTVVRWIFNNVPFLKEHVPSPIRRLRRFQNMPSKSFHPETIQKIHQIMEKTERKELPAERNALSFSFKIDIDQLGQLKITQTQSP
ncbi:transient receptor potential cation channel subfamily A member 1 homolog [Bolinopsis microptera]|uniref:transient receptor potential cation channel subfamily A member 1 homolog n=1 Tax=Bolinopsis microptera TaxID=2820187 RepID=UPI003079980E